MYVYVISSNKNKHLAEDLLKDISNVKIITSEPMIGELVHNAERTRKYIEKLKEYNAPEQLIENFKNTTNLWPMCACITRMQLACEKAWYEINFPEFKNR